MGTSLSILAMLCAIHATPAPSVAIRVDHERVDMGRSVKVDATVTLNNGAPAAGYRLFPYVSERRWGSHETTNEKGQATFLLPLPNPGPAQVQVLAYWPVSAYWLWAGGAPKDKQTVYLQKTFNVSGGNRSAVAHVAVDDHCEVFVNGKRLGEQSGWQKPAVLEKLEHHLVTGQNTFSIAASNGTGPAGVLARIVIVTDSGDTILESDSSWQGWTAEPAGWPAGSPAAVGAPAQPATVLGPLNMSPWGPDLKDWPGAQLRDDRMTGRPMPNDGLRSNLIEVEILRRDMPKRETSDRLVCIQWEPWFTPQNAYWQTAQAIPVLGMYDSYNRDVIRQHVLWFVDLGIDFIMPDWSNHIWGKEHWSEHHPSCNEIIHGTTLLLETLASMKSEGIDVPTVVLMPGLSNGPPTTMAAMNEQLEWIHETYLRNPRFDGLWLNYDGKPLIVILDTSIVATKSATPVDESHFTVRWMSTQLQSTHHEKFGYWTWMDGVLQPVVTYVEAKGDTPRSAEAVTVTPGYFAEDGWIGPKGRGRRGGTTYVESFKVAIDQKPRVVQLHQWNEYAGQPEGQGFGPNHNIYVDSYSVELSDDLEPVSLTAPGYRGDKGGWGFYYLNLTRALLDIYRGKAPNDTVLAVGPPLRNEVVSKDEIRVEWSVAGVPPTSYSVLLDGKAVADGIKETTYTLKLSGVGEGPHTVSIVANGAKTRYPLSLTEMDFVLDTPAPTRVDVPFTVSRPKTP